LWWLKDSVEVDPDKVVARRQVGRVATAVREFDRAAPGRRWLKRLGRAARFRHWFYRHLGLSTESHPVLLVDIAVLLVVVFLLGFLLGWLAVRFPDL
jgi:hypothetical protein